MLVFRLSSSRSVPPPAPTLPVGRDPAASGGPGGEAHRRLGPGWQVLGWCGGAAEHAQRLPGYCERPGGPRSGPLTHQTADWGRRGEECADRKMHSLIWCYYRSLLDQLIIFSVKLGHQGRDGWSEGRAGVCTDSWCRPHLRLWRNWEAWSQKDHWWGSRWKLAARYIY